MANRNINVVMKQVSMAETQWTEQNPVLQLGQIGVCSDNTVKFKIGDGETAWNDLPFSGGQVSSVNGKTGAVTLVKGDIGLDQVDNTSDLNKPISTATQAVLDGKANTTGTYAGLIVGEANKVSNALTISLNGTSQGAYDGSEAKELNITATSIGAAPTAHTHSQYLALDSTPDVEMAEARANIASGDTVSVMLGKIAKYFNDLGGLAFKSQITEDDISGTISADKITGSIGTAASADKLATAREFSIAGDVTAPAVQFDGTGNVTLQATLKNSGVTGGQYTKVTVDSKGIVTAGANLAASDIPDLTLSKITDAGTAAAANTGTAEGNVPVLGTGGKLDALILPAIAISETFVVEDEEAMLAIKGQTGDVAVRTDINKSFILTNETPTELESWQELLTPASPVQSVNGKTGVVTLTKADIGLGNVDNTADLNKPISTATQSALDLKANIDSPALTGTPTAPTQSSEDDSTKIATTAFVKAQGYVTAATAPVRSVAGKTGAVTLEVADLTNGTNVLMSTDTYTLQGVLSVS